MTPAAQNIVNYMMMKLSGCKYLYRTIVSGCYDVAIDSGLTVPFEDKEEIIDEFFRLLEETNTH